MSQESGSIIVFAILVLLIDLFWFIFKKNSMKKWPKTATIFYYFTIVGACLAIIIETIAILVLE